MKTTILRFSLLVPFLSFLPSCTKASSADNNLNSYKVAVQNLTAANLLSPYLVIVHKANTEIFTPGGTATAGLQQVAETGATDKIQAELAANENVIAVSKVEGTPLVAAEMRELTFNLDKDQVNAGSLVTVIAMIGKSNDSFISLQNVPLNSIEDGTKTMNAANYDAGTEENTANVEDLNTAGHPIAGAEGHISADRGLNPRGNAPEILGWGPVAARVSMTKL